MQYRNPLSIFTSDQIDRLLSGDYKNLKKELLLLFQLENKNTINLNGFELDKNAIIKTFDYLIPDIEFNLEIIKSKALLDYLEQGHKEFLSYHSIFGWIKVSPNKGRILFLQYFDDKHNLEIYADAYQNLSNDINNGVHGKPSHQNSW